MGKADGRDIATALDKIINDPSWPYGRIKTKGSIALPLETLGLGGNSAVFAHPRRRCFTAHKAGLGTLPATRRGFDESIVPVYFVPTVSFFYLTFVKY
jgi:hypothetical protein